MRAGPELALKSVVTNVAKLGAHAMREPLAGTPNSVGWPHQNATEPTWAQRREGEKGERDRGTAKSPKAEARVSVKGALVGSGFLSINPKLFFYLFFALRFARACVCVCVFV